MSVQNKAVKQSYNDAPGIQTDWFVLKSINYIWSVNNTFLRFGEWNLLHLYSMNKLWLFHVKPCFTLLSLSLLADLKMLSLDRLWRSDFNSIPLTLGQF